MSSIVSIAQEYNSAHLDPAERISKDGYRFNINSNLWILNKDKNISFTKDVLSIEKKLLDGLRKTLSIYAEEQSAAHASNMYYLFKKLLRDTKFKFLDEHVILNWHSMHNNGNEYLLGSLRGFLISWHEYGYYGVSKDMVQLLDSLTISGNKKGISVANRCPYSGAFTDNEMLALNNELIRLFKEDSISFSCYAYVSLLQATARRPIQLRQLKSIDLQKIQNTKSNSFDFYLNIPRAKQRGVGFREEFKKLAITEDLYLILLNFIEQETKKLKYRFNTELTSEQRSQIPVFIDWPIVDKLSIQKNKLDDAMLASDILHISATDIREIILKDFKVKQKAISERTGDYIHITARRFRHTRGTNLGRKGLGPLIIAEALDHNDTQNVMVYTENTADTATYIDKAIGKQLAPFANAFLGRIIEQLDEGERGSDLTAHVPNKENEVVGACGTNDYCVKGYESCYTCMKFRPLLDAPHEKLLASLYAEKEIRLKATKREEYASTKDRLILAVEWVVQKCAEMKEVRSNQ